MFLMQIPATAPTPPAPAAPPPVQDVMPGFPTRTVGTPDSSPYGVVLQSLRERRDTFAPRIENPWDSVLGSMQQEREARIQFRLRIGSPDNRTPLGQAMMNLLAEKNPDGSIRTTDNITYNPEDGSFQRRGDRGKYFYQPDGSIFYTGGEITAPNGTVTRVGARTYRYTNVSSPSWDTSQVGQTRQPSTDNLNRLQLVPDSQGAFVKPGDGNRGRYFVQADGSIFYEGGTIGGQQANPQTYRNGRWCADQNTQMPGTNLIQSLKLEGTGTPRVFIERYQAGEDRGKVRTFYYVLNDGRLVWVQRGSDRIQVSNNGENWTDLTPQQAQAPEIQQAVRAIRAERTRTGYPQ